MMNKIFFFIIFYSLKERMFAFKSFNPIEEERMFAPLFFLNKFFRTNVHLESLKRRERTFVHYLGFEAVSIPFEVSGKEKILFSIDKKQKIFRKSQNIQNQRCFNRQQRCEK